MGGLPRCGKARGMAPQRPAHARPNRWRRFPCPARHGQTLQKNTAHWRPRRTGSSLTPAIRWQGEAGGGEDRGQRRGAPNTERWGVNENLSAMSQSARGKPLCEAGLSGALPGGAEPRRGARWRRLAEATRGDLLEIDSSDGQPQRPHPPRADGDDRFGARSGRPSTAA